MDNLGRAGVPGYVDNRYFDIFTSAILTSILSVGTAVAVDPLTNGQSTSTQNTDGSSTQSTNPTNQAPVGRGK